MKKIAIASDHAGYLLKEEVKQYLREQGFEVSDYGCYSVASVDYPDHIHPLAEAVSSGEMEQGIILCGSGNGAGMTANKHSGVRAALCWERDIARMARLHNNANILALPARYLDIELALELVKIFLETPFEGGRHQARIDKINIP